MVTISRIRTNYPFWASIRWKIVLAFFVVVAASFIVAATGLTGLVSDYMTEQRTREDKQAAENLAVSVEPLFQSVNASELNTLLSESANSLNGRLMVVDRDGKVQYDSFNAFCGKRLSLDEVNLVLAGNRQTAYGRHNPGRETVQRMSGETDADYVAYCVVKLTDSFGKRNGALVYISRIQEMMNSQESVKRKLIMVFLVIAAAALGLALILSRILTNPIVVLSRTMNKMGKGDFSVRVPVKGGGELRELAENYNNMAAQLENLDNARNQFVSNASHELKTPLATMKIMLESVLYQPDMPAELRNEFMQDINHEIDRLTGIISDLLTLTKMDTQGGMKTEMIDMSELTGQTIRLLREPAKKKRQHLTEEIEPDIFMEGDRIKLNQILYNLIDNAMKYTPEGGRIRVGLFKEETDLIWRVEDNGIGIPGEDKEHIFDRFYRVDKARSRETGGTGLGLSIVKQMVNMHGGTVEVESIPDKGSIFTVRFPIEPMNE